MADIDYDSLAAQARGTTAPVDYDALAQQARGGGVNGLPPGMNQPPSVPKAPIPAALRGSQSTFSSIYPGTPVGQSPTDIQAQQVAQQNAKSPIIQKIGDAGAALGKSPVTGSIRALKGLGELGSAQGEGIYKGLTGQDQGDVGDKTWKGLADTMGGAAEAATIPLMGAGVSGLATSPVKALGGMAGAAAGSGLAGAGAGLAGASPDQQELAQLLGGIGGGVWGYSKTPEMYPKIPKTAVKEGWWPDRAKAKIAEAARDQAKDWRGTALQAAQKAAPAGVEDPLSKRISAMGDVKQLEEPFRNHPIGDPGAGATELDRLNDITDAIGSTQEKIWDIYNSNILDPARRAGIVAPVGDVAQAATQRIRPDLREWNPDSAQGEEAALERLYPPGKQMSIDQLVERMKTLNAAERSRLRMAPASAKAAMDSEVTAAYNNAEREEILERLNKYTARPNDPDNPVGKDLRSRYGALVELGQDFARQRNAAIGADMGWKQRAVGFMARAGMQLGMGETRGAASNATSALANFKPEPNAGSYGERAFRKFTQPWSPINPPPPMGQSPIGVPPFGPPPPSGGALATQPPQPNFSMGGMPQWSIQHPPLLGAAPNISPAERAEPMLPPGRQRSLPPGPPPPIITPPPPDQSGPIPGKQGSALPIFDDHGEIKSYSASQSGSIAGPYQPGETRKINGVSYIRDEAGHWHPQPR